MATGRLIKYNEYYEHKNNGKNLGQLSLELAVKLESIRTSYQIFKKDYGYYNLPENLTKEELLNDIREWKFNLQKNRASNELFQLYRNFENLINGLAVSKANNNHFLQYDKKAGVSEENCNDFAFALMKEGRRCDKIMNEVERNIMETGTSKTYAKLNRINYDYK